MNLIFRCECNKKIEISMPVLVERNIYEEREERNINEERNNLVNLSTLLTNSINNSNLNNNSNPQQTNYVSIDFLTK